MRQHGLYGDCLQPLLPTLHHLLLQQQQQQAFTACDVPAWHGVMLLLWLLFEAA
jgi:hypothetical protein